MVGWKRCYWNVMASKVFWLMFYPFTWCMISISKELGWNGKDFSFYVFLMRAVVQCFTIDNYWHAHDSIFLIFNNSWANDGWNYLENLIIIPRSMFSAYLSSKKGILSHSKRVVEIIFELISITIKMDSTNIFITMELSMKYFSIILYFFMLVCFTLLE